MKKKSTFIISICSIIFLVIINNFIYKYPRNHPTLTVEYNNEKFEAGINELTWDERIIPGEYIGNSTISTGEVDIAKDMESIDVNSNDTLNLKLSYNKKISTIEAIEVIDDGKSRIATPLELENHTLKTPEEKGEHIYSVKILWDSSPHSCHCVSYVIKLNVI